MKILFIGDVYGTPGVEFLKKNINRLKEEYQPNIIIVNGENAASNGRGITFDIYKQFMNMGVNIVTLGNHAFDNKKVFEFINNPEYNIVRPCNYYNADGFGYKIIKYNDKKLLVINAMGRSFMNLALENPFLEIEKILQNEEYDYSFLDFHAEATAEKVTIAYYFDGKIDCIVGTHTHIPTADERVLPNKTLYQTDAGMTGPYHSSIGADFNSVYDRFIKGYSQRIEVASGSNWLNGTLFDIENKTIKRVQIIE